MRILNRPMFRYGGPIKEGVMHGMRNGGRTLAGGNQIGTPMGDRTGFANPKDKLIMGAATKILPKIGLKPGFMKPWWNKIKSTFGSTAQAPYSKVVPKQSPGGKILGLTPRLRPGGPGPNPANIGQVWTPKGWVARDPLYRVGSAAWQGKGMLGKPIKWAGKQIATPTGGLGLIFVGGKWLWPDKTPANENEIKEHLNQGGGKVPGHGDEGMTYTDPNKAEALAKAAQNKRMKSYLDMMGYDQSKKTAMSDALIDASALVQDATTEAGSLKKADWGKLINKAIQTTSKRLDKPEQIREAVGLMATKAAIEKDMSAEEDALKKIATKLQIKGLQKTLAGETLQESINAAYQKTGKFAAGSDLAGLARTKGIKVTKVLPTKDIPDGMSAIDYITNEINTAQSEGTPIPPGTYVIKDRLIEIDETGTITPIV